LYLWYLVYFIFFIMCIFLFYENSLLFLLDFLDVKFEFLTFKDVTISSSALSWTTSDAYKESWSSELLSNKWVNNSILGTSLKSFLCTSGFLRFSSLFFFSLKKNKSFFYCYILSCPSSNQDRHCISSSTMPWTMMHQSKRLNHE
jgi:hypothetical protein